MSKFISDLVGKKVKIYFTIYDKAAGRFDVTGVVDDFDDHFVKVLLKDKIILINISEINFIEYSA